jgi:hypothetical protein
MLPTQLTPLARKHTWRGVQHFEVEANWTRHRDAHTDPRTFFRILRDNYVKARPTQVEQKPCGLKAAIAPAVLGDGIPTSLSIAKMHYSPLITRSLKVMQE